MEAECSAGFLMSLLCYGGVVFRELRFISFKNIK